MFLRPQVLPHKLISSLFTSIGFTANAKPFSWVPFTSLEGKGDTRSKRSSSGKRNDNYVTWRVKGISWSHGSNQIGVYECVKPTHCAIRLAQGYLLVISQLQKTKESLLPTINIMWIDCILEMPKTAVGCTVYGYLQKKFKEQKYGNSPASQRTVDPSGGGKERDRK